jgi:predicted metal-binding membrane protein
MASTLPSRGEARSPPLVPAPSRRDRALIASCIVLITALAWAYLVHLNRHMTSTIEGDTMMAAMGMVTAVSAQWNIGLCGRRLEGLQLMRKSLGGGRVRPERAR